jgi:hypothetical protein
MIRKYVPKKVPCNLEAVPGTAERCMALPTRPPPTAEPRGRPPIADPCLENGLEVEAVAGGIPAEPPPIADPRLDVGRPAPVEGRTPPLVAAR